MHNPKKRRTAGATLIAATLFGTAIAGSAFGQANTGTPWKHAIIDPKGDAGIMMMGLRGGFAAKQGLDLQLPHLQNDVIMLRGLLAGELHSYEGGAATAVIAASRNADVKIIGCQWRTVVHSVFARTELKNAAEMKGATMAISAPNATPDMIGKAWLAQNKVPFSEVKFASLGNDPERYKALLGKVAMATVISIEFLPVAEKQGIKLVARGSDVMPQYLRLCTITTGKNLQARREDAVKFLAAQMQGYAYGLGHKDEVIKLTREIINLPPDNPRPAFMFNEASDPKHGIDPKMNIDMNKLNWLQEQLVKAGNLKAPYDLSKIIDSSVRAEALKRAGLSN